MNISLRKHFPFAALFAATVIVYLPALVGMVDIFNRGNDLQEFFWPVVHYVKQQILVHHTFPLWNNLFLSGTPLLPDPQSPLFYPPNAIFLLLPLDWGFLTLFLLHTFFGGVGIYLACRHGFNFSKAASTLAAILYITTPRPAGYLEAGHVGLVYTLAWLPYVAWASIQIAKEPKFKWSLLLGICLAALYYTHAITFAIAAVGSSLLVLTTTLLVRSKLSKAILFLVISALLTLGLTAVQLLPQLEWVPQTTRSLLLKDRDVYPKWDSKKEFLEALFVPWAGGWQNIWNLDTEKWLATGVLPTLFALWGFWKLDLRLKLLITAAGLGVVLIALNNVSPIYNLLLAQDWYVLTRVATRAAVILVLITVFLFGYAIDKARKKRLIFSLAALAIAESLALSWIWTFRPIPDQTGRFVPEEVYEFLASDKERFRVFCVTRCLSQKKAAEYNLELVEGYNTVQQKNYYDAFIQISQVYWNRYTLALPPFEIYNFREIQPHAPTLAAYNIKYAISPYRLKDSNLVLEKEISTHLIYKNLLVKPRVYFSTGEEVPILKYTPNYIKIDASSNKSSEIVLAEVWSPGWKAYLNGQELVEIKQPADMFRRIAVKQNTMFVDFKYEPPEYLLGRSVTLATITLVASFTILQASSRLPSKLANAFKHRSQ